jgi:hypothetical protein
LVSLATRPEAPVVGARIALVNGNRSLHES